MAATATRAAMLDATYSDVEKLIYWTVHRFVERRGGDFQECLSIANFHFMLCYDRYDPKLHAARGSFPNYVRYVTYKVLMEDQRERARRGKLARLVPYPHDNEDEYGVNPIELAPDPHHTFNVKEFLEELGEDARMVAKLALDTPAGLAKVMVARGGRGVNRRSVIRHYLSELGWTAARIAESFSEIREVIATF